ncbi:MAG: hypothetical protein IKJ83_00310 [Ruminococcus sp.]|nr:hypothetical protein [Ruminococcus sp.]
MNFSNFDFGASLEASLSSMEESRRFPHAVIITGGNAEKRKELCRFLSMWAVCRESEKPCGECAQCKKADNQNHIDIYFAKGSGKTNVISVEEIRNITRDSAIMPHEAMKKIYVLEDADKRMGGESLNAFLKTLEEPSQDTLFLLTAENVKAVPQTILSRCAVLSLESISDISEEIKAQALSIVSEIGGVSELPLLKALAVLDSRQSALEILPVVRLMLSDALALSVGAESLNSDERILRISRRLTKSKLIGLIDATTDAINKTNRNVGLTLLSTWLCGEYRRIICVM